MGEKIYDKAINQLARGHKLRDQCSKHLLDYQNPRSICSFTYLPPSVIFMGHEKELERTNCISKIKIHILDNAVRQDRELD